VINVHPNLAPSAPFTLIDGSASFNLSKTVSNISLQNSNNLIGLLGAMNNNINLKDYSSNKKEIEIVDGEEYNISSKRRINDEDEDVCNCNSNRINVNNNISILSNNSVIYLNKDKKVEISNRSIFYTPSTICNYYQHSNDVTPYKNSNFFNFLSQKENSNSPNLVNIQNLKINLKSVNISNNLEEENINSSRNLHSFLDKKTPIKYNKSQINKSASKSANNTANTNANKSSSSHAPSPSPFVNIFKMDSKPAEGTLESIANEIKKTFNISQLEIDDKVLDEEETFENKRAPFTPTLCALNRKNLNYTFNKIKTEETEESLGVHHNTQNANMNTNITEEKEIIKREEKLSFDINSANSNHFITNENNNQEKNNNLKDEFINKLSNNLMKHNLYPNLKCLLKKNKSKPESLILFDSFKIKGNLNTNNDNLLKDNNSNNNNDNVINNKNSKIEIKQNEEKNLTQENESKEEISNKTKMTNNNENKSINNSKKTKNESISVLKCGSFKSSPKLNPSGVLNTVTNTNTTNSKSSTGSVNNINIVNHVNVFPDMDIKEKTNNTEESLLNKTSNKSNLSIVSNLNKIIIQPVNEGRKSSLTSNSNRSKKSNSIVSSLTKKKYIDMFKLFSNKSSNSLVSPLIRKKSPPSSTNLNLNTASNTNSNTKQSNSKGKYIMDNGNDKKIVEYTFNIEQKMKETKNSKINSEKLNLTSNNSNTNNKTKDSGKKDNSLMNNTILTQNSKLRNNSKSIKVINNFSNYTKTKSVANMNKYILKENKENNKKLNNPNSIINNINTTNTISTNQINSLNRNLAANMKNNYLYVFNTLGNNQSNYINSENSNNKKIKKQIVSTKINNVIGDEDSVLLDE
jgi:hypothetical protein